MSFEALVSAIEKLFAPPALSYELQLFIIFSLLLKVPKLIN